MTWDEFMRLADDFDDAAFGQTEPHVFVREGHARAQLVPEILHPHALENPRARWLSMREKVALRRASRGGAA